MASAPPLPLTAFSPNHACPAIVSSEDVDYLVDVLRLDNGKSESDLDDEILAKAGALSIDITNLPTADQCPTPGLSVSTAPFPACHRGLTPSTLQSSAASSSSVFETMPAATSTKHPADLRRWSETLDFSLYKEYVSQLGPNMSQPKFAKGRAATGGPLHFGFSKKKSISTFRSGFMTRMPWGKRAFPKSAGAT